MNLFATHPPQHVTVADIAAAANMTAAAVYYHFPSKEHVLLEGLHRFTASYLETLRDLAAARRQPEWPLTLVGGLLEWFEDHRVGATVYFAHSAGVDVAIEALRRATRIEEVHVLGRAIRAHTAASRSSVAPEVAAIGLVSLIESSASSWLVQDAVFVGLGRRRFVAQTAAIAERIIGGGATIPDGTGSVSAFVAHRAGNG